MPKSNLSTGTETTNAATIVFDANAPIPTPIWTNAIDNTIPASQVMSLSPTQALSSFTIFVNSTDVGAGVMDETIYVSTNGGSFGAWLVNRTNAPAVFNGEPGKTYAFFSIARDFVGNIEAIKSMPDTQTYVAIPPIPTNDNVEAVQDTLARIPVTFLLLNDHDPAGSLFGLAAVDVTTVHGGTVAPADGELLYTPPNSFVGNDGFHYTITNTAGGAATAVVNVRVHLPNIAGVRITQSNSVVIRFLGRPGQTYGIERTSSLVTPVWVRVGSVVADANGLYEFEDAVALGSTSFYRAVYP
jgi:hypothetical protein